jgi:hypothetical protein
MKACVGCGYCCTKRQCGSSIVLHGEQLICPELKWTGTRHVCKLMLGEDAIMFKELLAADTECCSPMFNTFRENLRDLTNQQRRS